MLLLPAIAMSSNKILPTSQTGLLYSFPLSKRKSPPCTEAILLLDKEHFGLSERFWLNLQSRYDLEVEKDKLDMWLEREVRVLTLKSA